MIKAISDGAGAVFNAIRSVDLRAWFAVALVLLTWRIIEIIAINPALLANASFMQLITPIVGAGGLLLVATFLFGSNKESEKKTTALADNARTMRDAGIPLGRRADDAPLEPAPVIVSNPYAAKTDEELRQLLNDRGEKPAKTATPEEMIAKLTELDAAIPATEPTR